MPRPTAKTPKPLSVAERKARLAALVKRGVMTKEQAALIDFREPSDAVIQFARTLGPRAQAFLARGKRAAA